MNIIELLTYVAENHCSDLHLSEGEKPIVRKNGNLERLDEPVLTHDAINEMLREIMTDKQYTLLDKNAELDFSYTLAEISRFRINVFHQTRGLSAALRRLSFKSPSFDDINLTAGVFKTICQYPNGLVLVTGSTGSGKSTTLAAMINHINSTADARKHILTVEDPIEYVFESKSCLIQQREVGRDTALFTDALRAALREDPDIIMVGEMRDLETIRLAITAAETGHLVFATLHTNSAPGAIDRMIDVFPGDEEEMIREMLAESLRCVIAQRLMKTPNGGIRPAYEVLMCTKAVRNLIRGHKIPQLYSAMQTGKKHGMQTLEQHIEELLSKNEILPEYGNLLRTEEEGIDLDEQT